MVQDRGREVTGASVREPRGSKLDAKKRAAYRAEVEAVENWDTRDWGAWTVTGRILPERCDVNIPSVISQGVGTGGRMQTRLEVVRSHVVMVCLLENAAASGLEIADAARSALMFPVDYIAFQNQGAYEIVLDLCINNRTGDVWAIPISEPIFEESRDGFCFDPSAEIQLPLHAAVPELTTALHDLTQAVRYPRRTFEQCRMAVEMVRHHFDPPTVKSEKDRRIAGEKALCAALKVTRQSLIALDRVAARSRHGDLIISINWEKRRGALELAWEIVARFVAHLNGAPTETWCELDVQVED